VISTFLLPKIGESHARALFLTGERFDAARAQRIGLVHEVVADEAAMDERIAALLAELTAAGPTATRAAKALLRDLRVLDADAARRLTPVAIARQRQSVEGQEGLAAFLAKRPPRWKA
jgi:methylglutaconyl-CoA hydratase